MISKERLMQEAKRKQYKPEILEKVYRLLLTLEQFMAVPFLRERLVLKGGTALNLFYFEQMPRLSVDIDLNYIGSLDRQTMLEERAVINDAIYQILKQNQFEFYRNPSHHAGGKMIWRYPSALGQMGNLEIDINYMHRQLIWPIAVLPSKLIIDKVINVPTVSFYELAAGKLSALFSRQASRDLFDAHYLLTQQNYDVTKLRITLVIYLAMTEISVDKIHRNIITMDVIETRNKLLPVLHQKDLPKIPSQIKQWAEKLVQELQGALLPLLPLQLNEIEFITLLRTQGKIEPGLITEDKALAKKIITHPALQWRSQAARKY